MFFFFKQKTAYEMRISDWSSDVCSSDLLARGGAIEQPGFEHAVSDDHGRRDGQSLPIIGTRAQAAGAVRIVGDVDAAREHPAAEAIEQEADRKSTRLNSSH